jgi:serine/threonine-protein kinase
MSRIAADRWRILRPHLDELLELDPEARESRLKAIAVDDPALADELRTLTTAHDNPPAILNGPLQAARGTPPPVDDEPLDPLLGTTVAGYRLIGRLGRGGMATVYLAERIDGRFEHRVAIKIMRPGAAADALARRFRDEQQILASLNHPNIARLYSGGLTNDGVPYMIMELVDGVAIDRYCNDNHLDIYARVALFRMVCSTVEYAHSSLVVHRDLKPSNILVRTDGAIKLLDFGVAKLLETPTDTEPRQSTVTSLYGTPMTPDYAAPEQILGGPVTTAVDVYALGVLLHELLTGRRPLSLASLDPVRMAATIIDAKPERPSSVVARELAAASGDALGDRQPISDVAGDRRTTPAKLISRLQGDLDIIVLTALRKETERRYASVALLREDLERHQEHLPVRARPDSWPYVLNRFTRRHRVAAALSVGIALALVVGLATALAGQRAARREALTADRVSRFLIELLRAPDPNVGRGGDTTAAELLDDAAQRIDTELASEPEVRATMLLVIGESYLAVGDHDRARALVEEGATLWTGLRGATAEETIAARDLLAAILRDSGHLDEAESLFNEVLTATSGDPVSPELQATVLNDYGMLLREQGRVEEAESRYREAIGILRREGGLKSQDGARTLSNLAMAVRRQDRQEEAESLLREALAIQREILGEPHVDVARTLNNLAAVRRRAGDLDDAERLYRQAFEQRLALYGEIHPEVAQSLNNLGSIRYYRGDLDGAAESFERALEIWQHFFAGDHPRVADALSNLGSIRRSQGRTAEAEDLLGRAATMQERLHGADHPLVGLALFRWGRARLDAGRVDDARPLLERALAIQEVTEGAGHRHTISTAIVLGRAFVEAGERRRAAELLDRSEAAAADAETAAAVRDARDDLGISGS